MTPADLPAVTHLQFLVLSGLRDGSRSGPLLRERLRTHGVRRSGPAFYQMMARLEDAGLVEGRYRQRVEEGRGIKERAYTITAAGEAAWEGTRAFYLSVASTASGPEAADG